MTTITIPAERIITAEMKAAEAAASLKARFQTAIEAHVDEVARQRQYSGAVSISTYVNSTNPAWAAEAQAFVAWRDAVWGYAFTELAKVEAEERAAPESEEAFIAELPAMQWPE